MDIQITSFYRFHSIPEGELPQLKTDLENMAKSCGVLGLVILAKEGINTTFSGPKESVAQFKDFVCSIKGFENLSFKDSFASSSPFRRFKVQLREEIVTLGRPDISSPNESDTSHLSPTEWNHILKNEKDFLLIDTRNWYETKIGKFKGAIAPDISEFTDFPKWLEDNNIPKDKKILVYCTGGIRCEKGQPDMLSRGYKEVYQLKDGILKYLEEFPNDAFEGECFVFDHRVALDQNLRPSKIYDLCPHCGQPAKDELNCVKCDTTAKVCESCLTKAKRYKTCSKNCAHHFDLKSVGKIRPHTNEITAYRKQKQS